MKKSVYFYNFKYNDTESKCKCLHGQLWLKGLTFFISQNKLLKVRQKLVPLCCRILNFGSLFVKLFIFCDRSRFLQKLTILPPNSKNQIQPTAHISDKIKSTKYSHETDDKNLKFLAFFHFKLSVNYSYQDYFRIIWHIICQNILIWRVNANLSFVSLAPAFDEQKSNRRSTVT